LLPEPELHARAAGGSPYDMARQPGRLDVRSLLAAAELVDAGPDGCQQALERLADPDPAARFWAATALVASGPDAEPAEAALQRLLDDPSASVRLAAAEALCRQGEADVALPILTAALEDEEAVVRLYAAITLAAIGPQAEPVLPQIRAALDAETRGGNYSMYIRWALERVLREVDSSQTEVPGNVPPAP
jgi:HEAT repeat protein